MEISQQHRWREFTRLSSAKWSKTRIEIRRTTGKIVPRVFIHWCNTWADQKPGHNSKRINLIKVIMKNYIFFVINNYKCVCSIFLSFLQPCQTVQLGLKSLANRNSRKHTFIKKHPENQKCLHNWIWNDVKNHLSRIFGRSNGIFRVWWGKDVEFELKFNMNGQICKWQHS